MFVCSYNVVGLDFLNRNWGKSFKDIMNRLNPHQIRRYRVRDSNIFAEFAHLAGPSLKSERCHCSSKSRGRLRLCTTPRHTRTLPYKKARTGNQYNIVLGNYNATEQRASRTSRQNGNQVNGDYCGPRAYPSCWIRSTNKTKKKIVLEQFRLFFT